MSNTLVFSNTARKSFTGLSLDGTIAAVIPVDMTGVIKPSDIHVNGDTVKSALGAALTPVAFATGCAWVVSRAAYGAKLEGMVDGIPAHVRHAVIEAVHGLKIGAGIECTDLRNRIKTAFAALLALPAKREKPVVVSTTGVTVQEADTEEITLTDVVDVPVIVQVHGNAAVIAAQAAHDAAWEIHGDSLRDSLREEAAQQSRVDAGFRTLNAENAALRAVLDDVAQCKNIKQVHAILVNAGLVQAKAA